MSRGFSIIVSCNAPGNLQPECLQLLSPKPESNSKNTWKLMVGRPLLFFGGEMGRWPIFGAMLVLESVIASLRSTSINPLLINRYFSHFINIQCLCFPTLDEHFTGKIPGYTALGLFHPKMSGVILAPTEITGPTARCCCDT